MEASCPSEMRTPESGVPRQHSPDPAERKRPMASGLTIRRVLVVCLGNICRSPIAEFVLRKHLEGRDVIVESAGIAATHGARIDPLALAVLYRHGIDADRHVARRLDKSMIDAADLVLVMEREHLEFIRAGIPSATGKTFLLGKWQGDFEIPDPYGKPRETFDHLYRAVDIAARRWCELI
jgi:protein-tyrosine phosphatase